jgi:hypothetical protein
MKSEVVKYLWTLAKGISQNTCFIQRRRRVVCGRMEALSVVEFFYEFRDVAFGVLMAFIFLLSNPFALQTSEEAFDH